MPVHVGKLHKESFENAINLLKEEKSIGIFPEGTRNKTDQLLLPLRKGTTLLAKKTNAKIIPFAITGKYRPFDNRIWRTNRCDEYGYDRSKYSTN